MYYLDRDTCTCIRCGTGSCYGGEWYLPQVCEVENSEDSGCRTCGEEHCAEDEIYRRDFCSSTSSGCLGPLYFENKTCQYSCGGQCCGPNPKEDDCHCDHVCADFGDCCSDFSDWCIWGHNCPIASPMIEGELENGCPLYILDEDQFGNHTECSDSTLDIGDWCESDGECGYSNSLDNCPVERSSKLAFYLDIFVVREKALSLCVDDGTITCSSGEYIDTERYCTGSECTELDTQCCNIPDRCLNATYVICPYHQFWDYDNGVTCNTKRCKVDECCKDKAGCEEAEGLVTCPSHKFLDTSLYCSEDVCDSDDDNECCTAREYCNNTALVCSDEDNYFLDVDIPDLCATRCIESECCRERASCAQNTVLTCNSTQFLDHRQRCQTDECLITDTQCCQARANCDETVICSESTFSDPNQFCATDVCEQSDNSTCCQPKANCIDDGTVQCQSDFFIDTDMFCNSDVCVNTDTQCCQPRASCDGNITCSTGNFSDPNNLCATDVCMPSDVQCCEQQSNCNDDVECGYHLYVNTTKYCSTDTCTPNDFHCCESCNKPFDIYPLEGVCPGASAPKDGSRQMCELENLDMQHRFQVAIANQLWSHCEAWCIYDLYSNGELAFSWRPHKEENGCYISATTGVCFEKGDHDKVLPKIDMLCEPEPYDACAPMDTENDCEMVWDVDPVENPVGFNRLIYCYCRNPLFWGFRDWTASKAVLCNDEGHGLDTRLHLALANHGWGTCVNWCIFDIWEPETYSWIWDRSRECYYQLYNDLGLDHTCSRIWNEATHVEYQRVANYTDGLCTEKDIEWALSSKDQSCSKRCGELSRSCDGKITLSVNNSLSESEALEYFSLVGVTCSDIIEGDHGIGGGSGYYPNRGNCVLISTVTGYSYRQYCEVSPISTFQRICACVKAPPNKPSPY